MCPRRSPVAVPRQGYNGRRNQALASERLLAPLLVQGAPTPVNASVVALLASCAAAELSPSELSRRADHLLALFQRHGYGVTDTGSGTDGDQLPAEPDWPLPAAGAVDYTARGSQFSSN